MSGMWKNIHPYALGMAFSSNQLITGDSRASDMIQTSIMKGRQVLLIFSRTDYSVGQGCLIWKIVIQNEMADHYVTKVGSLYEVHQHHELMGIYNEI